MLWKEGVGVHHAITELPLHKGEFGQDSHHRGQGHLPSDPIPAGCPRHVTGIP